jgi:rhodanese-related sulfurtransferase
MCARSLASWLGPAATLFGVAPGAEGQSLAQLLTESRSAQGVDWHPDQRRATFETEYGDYCLWFSAGSDQRLIRILLTKSSDDLGEDGKRLNAPLPPLPIGVEQTIPYENVVREEFDITLPIADSFNLFQQLRGRRQTHFASGRSVVETFILYAGHSADAARAVHDPQSMLSAFADGTRVSDQRARGIFYEIRDGLIVPVVDEVAIDRILSFTSMLKSVRQNNHIDTHFQSGGERCSERRGEGAASPPVSRWFTTPYCGLYSVFAAATLLGKDVDFATLIHPAYVGSTQGSSLAELARAAEQCGISARPIAGLRPAALARLGGPAVLHIRSSPFATECDHYVLLARADSSTAVIMDGPDSLRTVSLGEVSAYWNGTVLMLSAGDASLSGVLVGEYLYWALIAVGTLILVVVGQSIVRRIMPLNTQSGVRSRAMASAYQASMLGGLAVVLSVGISITSKTGLIANDRGVHFIESRHAVFAGSPVTMAEIRSRRDIVLIDARPFGEYASGHIRDAINVDPVTAVSARALIDIGITPDKQLVVYCKNAQCPFSKRVAVQLMLEGYENVRLFPGGWDEWSTQSAR